MSDKLICEDMGNTMKQRYTNMCKYGGSFPVIDFNFILIYLFGNNTLFREQFLTFAVSLEKVGDINLVETNQDKTEPKDGPLLGLRK